MPEIMDYSTTITTPTTANDVIVDHSDLVITEQPRKYLRYRYASEKKSTHGVLRGHSTISRSQETFPAIKLIVSPNNMNKDYYVLISLYKPPTLGENQGLLPNSKEPIIFSPNLLAKKEAKIKKTKQNKKINNNNNNNNNNIHYKSSNGEKSSSEDDDCDDDCDASSTHSSAKGSSSSSSKKKSSRNTDTKKYQQQQQQQQHQQQQYQQKGKNQQSNAKITKENRKKFEMYQKPLVEKMQRVNGRANEFEYFLKDCFIIRTKKELKDDVIKQKYLELAKWEKQKDELSAEERREVLEKYEKDKKSDPSNNKQNFESVCLGFTVYWRDPQTKQFKLFHGPVLSNAIINGEALSIHKICNPRGNLSGETEVTLLAPEAKQNDIEVHMFEIYQNDQGLDTRVWEHCIRECDLTIYKNVAITFRTPPYTGPNVNTTDDISCYILLRRPSDNNESSPVKFIYSKNDRYNNYYQAVGNNDNLQVIYTLQYNCDEEPKAKRACYGLEDENAYEVIQYPGSYSYPTRLMEATIADASMAPIELQTYQLLAAPNETAINYEALVANATATGNDYESMPKVEPKTEQEPATSQGQNATIGGCIQETEAFKTLKKTIAALENCDSEQEISKQLKEYTKENGKVLFHDAAAMNALPRLYSLFDKHTILSRQLRAAVNEHKETVLHYVCRLDKASQIKPLINQGCSLDAQDQNRRTPMHIALHYNKMECIKTFCRLIEDSATEAKYRHFRKQLKRVLNLYDEQNYTILHRAIMQGQEDLVNVLLEFCKAEGIDPMKEYTLLGNGDTLLHLAKTKNLAKMIEIICKQCPRAKSYENYAGHLAIEDSLDSYADE